ncbi:MAG: class I SAM-dependent methyltransferase [Proteobacteria bacterium]|nr:class I SAM-dependent methyltransferase [Pseudomonadota bacterium]
MALKSWFKASPLFSFNLVNRDRWVAAQAASLPAGAKVLDMGAGSCPYRPLFAHCRYQTQDFAGLEGEQLRHGNYGEIDYRCDIASVPVADGEFDAILCTEVLEHVREPIKVVQEMARILKPGGRLMLTAPLGSGIHQEPYHYYGGYTRYWYQDFLAAAGFAQIRVEANAGSFRFFAQEAIRFVQTTRPFKLGMPLLAELLWLPLWLLLAPVLGLALPVVCRLLDRFDREQRFTVGYHVTAVRN